MRALLLSIIIAVSGDLHYVEKNSHTTRRNVLSGPFRLHPHPIYLHSVPPSDESLQQLRAVDNRQSVFSQSASSCSVVGFVAGRPCRHLYCLLIKLWIPPSAFLWPAIPDY